jgi:hypothetical protein
MGVGYNVLNFDFAQAEQPLVHATFRKRWTDANASWSRMVDPVGFWNFNITTFLPFGQLFRDTTMATLYWTQFHSVLPPLADATAVKLWAESKAAFLSTIVADNDISNLEYYCFSNEEEGIVPRGNATAWILYNNAIRAALDASDSATKNVKLVGTDFYSCDTALQNISEVASVDSYSCHHYGAEGYTDMMPVLAPAIKVSHAQKKKFLSGRIWWQVTNHISVIFFRSAQLCIDMSIFQL